VGVKFEAFNRDISLLFHVVTRTPEGELWKLYEVHEIGDLIEAKKCWRKVVREHPNWHHTIQLGNGTDVFRNDPTHKGKRPREIWLSPIHRGGCKTCYRGDIIPSSGGTDGVCTTCGPVKFDAEARVWF
jgi:hypothetical protein